MTESDDKKMASDALEDEAFEWLTRLTSGEVTTGELRALARWRAQSASNEAAFVEAGKLWHSVKPAVETVARQDKGVAGSARFPRTNMNIGRRAMLGGGLAASAAYLIARPPLGLWPSLSELTSDYRTVTGQQRRITTGGGATIDLNTQTSLDVRLAPGGADRIELIAGEAAITTAANASRSIVALAGDGRVTATDATFNMRRNASLVCITCVTGAVLVEHRGRPATLQQSQQVSYTDEGLGPAVEVDPVGVTAWQQGILVFHDEPLGRVIEEVNRYWPGRIIVANANLGKRLVTARFKLDHLDDAITQIQLVFHANVTRLPGGMVVLSS
jgi:transmembrane sensor